MVGRRVGVAVVTALLVGGTVLAGAGTAAAADPPTNRIAVASWYDNTWFDLITDDAVYVHERVEGVSDEIFRLPLTTDGTGTTIGAPQYVGSAVPYSKYAEHEGTIAYLRADDEAVVVQAADGSSSVLTWAPPAAFSSGVLAMTDAWIVGAHDWATPTVFNLATGAELDLLALSTVPAGDCPSVRQVAITDERVAWVAGCDVFPPGYLELLTVALDADGVVGTPTSIGRVLRDDLDWAMPFTEPAIVGSTVFWQSHTPNVIGDSTRVLKWRGSAPYNATPGTMTLPSYTYVTYTGDKLVLDTGWSRDDGVGTPMFSASWRSTSAPGTQLWSTGSVTGSFAGASGPLYVFTTGDSMDTAWLADVTGRPVRADGWIPPITFTDVWPWDAFGNEIMWLARQGLTTGYADGTFRRQGTVNRDAMAAFLYRITHDGADAPDCTEAAFTDVPASHPFCGEIAWLADTGITTGWADGTFRPGQPVTREAMAAFLFRLHRMYNPSTPVTPCTTAPFADVATSHPFCGAIDWLADTGVSTGWADHTFRPGALVERQAMAAFLFRFVDNGLLFPPR